MGKRTVLLLVLFVALILIYWLARSKEPVVKKDRPFIEADSAAVTSLDIVYGRDSVALDRHEDGWWVEYPIEYPAMQRTVEDAVSRLSGMNIESLITDSPENFDKYEVDSVGVRVYVSQAKVKNPVGFIIGKTASDYQHTYLRHIGDNHVWLVKGSYRTIFAKGLKDWRDRTITDVPMDSVRRVELIYPKETITLTLEDTVWHVSAGGKTFDGERPLVDRLLRLLCRLSTVDFLDTLGTVSFASPEVVIRAELSGYEPIELKLVPLDEKGDKYAVEKSGARTHFVIYKTTATTLMKKPEDFRNEAKAKKEEMLGRG
jgi:hypothetical protein